MLKLRRLALLATLMLLCVALPVAAQADTARESAQAVWQETQLMLPVPADASDMMYSVEDGAVAQVDFTYGDTMFVLRLKQTPAMQDVCDVEGVFGSAEPYEEYSDYQCVYAATEYDVIAWWFDAERSVSGMLRCAADAYANFDVVLYDVVAGLRRGFSYAGRAAYAEGALSLEYPLVQTEDEALTDKLNANMLEAVRAVAATFAPDARLDNAFMSVDITGKVLTAEWCGVLAAPNAAYEDALVFTVHADCETGELAPLHALLDTDKLAENTYPKLLQSMSSQDWDDPLVDEAQRDYLKALSLEDWKDLLQRADFPTQEGWPPAFSSWRDGGYFRDGNEEEYPCLIVYLVVPHALQSQITLSFPFAQTDPELAPLLHVQ